MTKLLIDFRLDNPGFEVNALRSSVDTLEAQLATLTAERTASVDKYVASLEYSEEGHADAQLAFQELEWEVENTLPRIYRGGLLILIWAAYESGVEEVAEFIGKRMPVRIGLSDLRGRSTLDRAKKYYPEVLRFELFAEKNSLARLREIELVRNAFAHANGRMERASVGARKTLAAMVESGRLKEFWNVVVPTGDFLRSSLRVVESEISSLVDRAKAWDDARPTRVPESQNSA